MREAKMSETAERLLDLAERRFRLEGYNAVSFRQLADEIGVKSASVHYHFPTKEALGVAVVTRYRERIEAHLGEPSALPEVSKRLDRFVGVFLNARLREGLICLCAMLGAEAESLPTAVREAVNGFFEVCLNWLEAALDRPGADEHKLRARAMAILSILEGGMVVSGTMQDKASFELVCGEAVKLGALPV